MPDQHDVDERADHVVGADVEEPLELVDVVVQDRHQPAGALVLEVGELQAAARGRRRPSAPRAPRSGPGCATRAGSPTRWPTPAATRRVQHRQRDELAPRAVDPGDVGDPGVVPAHDHVHRGADQDLRHDVEDLVRHRQGRAAAPPGRGEGPVAPEPEEGVVVGHGLGHARSPREGAVRRLGSSSSGSGRACRGPAPARRCSRPAPR